MVLLVHLITDFPTRTAHLDRRQGEMDRPLLFQHPILRVGRRSGQEIRGDVDLSHTVEHPHRTDIYGMPQPQYHVCFFSSAHWTYPGTSDSRS